MAGLSDTLRSPWPPLAICPGSELPVTHVTRSTRGSDVAGRVRTAVARAHRSGACALQWRVRIAVAHAHCSGACASQWRVRIAVARAHCSGAHAFQWCVSIAVVRAHCSDACTLQWCVQTHAQADVRFRGAPGDAVPIVFQFPSCSTETLVSKLSVFG
jgi:hypothetical protein